jgi:hypothetical protein
MKRFDYLIIAGLVIGLGLTIWGISMGSAKAKKRRELRACISISSQFSSKLFYLQIKMKKRGYA